MLTTTPRPVEDPRSGPGRPRRAVDPDAPPRVESRPVTMRRPVRVVVRQRRVVAGLVAATLVLGLVAATAQVAVAWALAGVTLLLAVGYLAAVARIRGLAVEREMMLAFGPGPRLEEDAWDAIERDLVVQTSSDPEPVLEATAERGVVAKFVLASMLGWLLTPVVAVIRLAHGDLSDLRRRGVLDRLVRAQQYGRSRSLQMLTVSVAATAGVTGVAMSAGVSLAAATPAAATAKPSTVARSAAGAASSYTVRAGDTLGAIAAQYGVPTSTLAAANGIAHPDQITTGQTLTVHLPPYTVRAGDTLGVIAARYGRSVSGLAAANGIADANVITVGQVLHVGGSPLPAVSQPKPPAPPVARQAAVTSAPAVHAAAVAATTPAAPAAPALIGSGTYRVAAGDTLGAIAARFNTWTASLVAANHLASANAISVGQLLQVGGQGANAPRPAPVATAAPVAAPAPAAPAAPALIGSGTYRVAAGDTLGAIAARFNTWTASLVAANHLASANAISVGQLLQVGGQGANTPRPVVAPTAAAPPAPVRPVVAPTPAPAPPPPPPPAPVHAASGAALAVRTALAQVGKPYVYGAAGPSSFDCSGLVMYAWAAAGVSLPHYSGAQYSAMTHVSMSDLQPGDVVFFADTGAHEAMYIGGGKIVEAPYTGADVRVLSLYSEFVLAGRP